MELLIKYFDALGVTEIVGGTEQLLKGLQEIQMELLRVGLDVQMAKARQQPLAEAALDFDNYPFLTRMQAGTAARPALPTPSRTPLRFKGVGTEKKS